MPELRQFNGLQLKKLLVIALLPWSMVLQETTSTKALAPLRDGAKITVAIGKDCETPYKQFTATVSRSPQARAKGLSNREKDLAPDEAMLFVFNPPEKVTFWMRETLIPLDLALFKPNGNLYDIRHMPVEADPSDPKKLYNSSADILFALEVPYESLSVIAKKPGLLCVDSTPILPRKPTPSPSPKGQL